MFSQGDSDEEDDDDDEHVSEDESDDEGDDNDGDDENDGDDDNDGHDDNDDGDDDNKNDDDDETDSDRSESDRDENPEITQSHAEQQEEEDDDSERVHTPPEFVPSYDEEKIDKDEDEYDEVTKELYRDVNINLGNEDAEMTNADQGGEEPHNVSQDSGFQQEEEDAYILNLDNTPPCLDETSSQTSSLFNVLVTAILEITSVITVPPPPSSFNPLLQQTTPTPTPTTSEATTSFLALPDFSLVFKFNDRVTNLEKTLSEMKQVTNMLKPFPLFLLFSMAISAINYSKPYRKPFTPIMQNAEKKLLLTKRTHVIEKTITKSLEAAVLAKSSSQPKSTYEAAASLSEFELMKILMDKMEETKSYQVADYKKELYEALVKSYNTDKDLFNSYGEVFSLKRGRDEKDKDQDPFAGSDRGTKRRKTSKEGESYKDSRSKEKQSSSTSKGTSHSQHKSFEKSTHVEETIYNVDDSGVQNDQEFVTENTDKQPDDEAAPKFDWFKKPDRPPTPDHDWTKRQQINFKPPQTWISKVAHAQEPPTSFDKLTDTPFDFPAFVLNRLNINNLTQEILDYFINNDLEYLKGGSLSREYSTSVTKSKAATYEVKWIEDLASELWSPEKSLDEIEVRRDDQKLYTFKEGDFLRLRLQDIEDMLLLLVQQKLTNLTIDEWYDLNVALRMYTIRIVISTASGRSLIRCQSNQKKLNLTRQDTFRSGLRRRNAYTAYSDPHGVIYMDQNSRNRLMRTDELYKFSDGTLNDVQTFLQDITSDLRMDYLPKKNSKKFVGGREYEEDLGLLERTCELQPSCAKTFSNIDAHVEGEQFMKSKTIEIVMDPVTLCTTLPSHSKSERLCFKTHGDSHISIDFLTLKHQSDTYVFTVKMEILPVSTSNSTAKDSILQAGNPVKEILLKLNLPDHRTPIDTKSKLDVDSTLISHSTLYMCLVGALMYFTFTRPDLSYVVQQVCLYMLDPWEPHLAALKRIILFNCVLYRLRHCSNLSKSMATQELENHACKISLFSKPIIKAHIVNDKGTNGSLPLPSSPSPPSQSEVSATYEDNKAIKNKVLGRKLLEKLYRNYSSELSGKRFAYDGEKAKVILLAEKMFEAEISYAAKMPLKSVSLALEGAEPEKL
ncbi:copia protein [Tanacetum coccineum]